MDNLRGLLGIRKDEDLNAQIWKLYGVTKEAEERTD